MKEMMTHVLKMLFPKAIVYLLKTKNLLLSAYKNNDMFPPETMLKNGQDFLSLHLFDFRVIVMMIIDKCSKMARVITGGAVQIFVDQHQFI